TAQMAYANSGYNDGWISFETCQSRTASDADFRANEEMVLRQMAEDLQFYGLPANLDTCKLHMQFGNTSCPHRTKAIHGSYAAAQGYMVERIKHYMSLGKTVKEMIANENKPKKPTKTTKFKVGDRVKLRGDKATHWAYVYTDLVKNGGEKLSERDIDKGLQGKTFVITWLADNQICELALLKPDGSLGQFRYAAYDWDLNKV
ncbi:MAG: hypothetical protein QP733_06930, partial [Dialister micraerophilus]|nr:hypothetical protein [Dialister micraerophilus]